MGKFRNLLLLNRENTADFISIIFLLIFNFLWRFPFLNLQISTGVFSAPLIPAFMIVFRYLGFSGEILRLSISFFLVCSELFGVLSFYFLIRALTGRRLPGLMAAFIYSLPLNFLALARLRFGLVLGDSSHIIALGFFPITMFFCLLFFKYGDFFYGLVCILFMALIGLISPFAFFNISVFLFVIMFSEMLLGDFQLKLFRFLFVWAGSFFLNLFWYTPRFFLELFRSPQGLLILDLLSKFIPLSLFIFPVLLVFSFLLFEGQDKLQSIFIPVALLVLSLLISLVEIFSYADIRKYSLLPHRFLPEVSFALSFSLGILGSFLLDWFSARTESFLSNHFRFKHLPRVGRQRGLNLGTLLLVWLILIVISFMSVSWGQIKEEINQSFLLTKDFPSDIVFWQSHPQLFWNCDNQLVFDSFLGFSLSLIDLIMLFCLDNFLRKKFLL